MNQRKDVSIMEQHYFIGIQIPLDLSSHVEEIRSDYRLRETYKVIPHIQDLHVTLLYLGSVSENKLHILNEQLASIANDYSSFSLTIDGISYFGSQSTPRVIFLSVEDLPQLNKLQHDIAEIVENVLNKPKNDNFTPHITIAKKWRGTDNFTFNTEKRKPIEISVPNFSLFKIEPNKRPKYEAVRDFGLK